MKQRKIFIFGIIAIIITTISFIYFVTKSNAENTGGTAGQREDEKTLVKMVASLSLGKDANNQVNIDTLSEELNKYAGNEVTTVTEKSSNIIEVTFIATGNIYNINVSTGSILDENEEIVELVSPSEIFDIDETNEDGLHIGDFINYDAGTWTAEEIAAIQTGETSSLVTANGTTSLPGSSFQFGGFTEGSSRNENATPKNTTYNYTKNADTSEAITGWRLFDIQDDGKVVLISAGNPEDYCHSSSTNNEYISEYILSGNVNSVWSTDEASNYQKRDWSNYVNTSQKAESATALSKDILNEWYTKYIVEGDIYTSNSVFQSIYSEPYLTYQNIVDNNSAYYLSTASTETSGYLMLIHPQYRFIANGRTAFGIRVVVTLSDNVLFTATKTGTITLTGGNMDTYGGDQTYNCWDIQ